ncbi:hypothetical protein M409DRAFT_21556 [Zasmidium cellare ATCC 36951]|uniref:Thiamine pyrophosphokinase n=1 Tax=Zasmidium cellare ATCC 36951 TaxID=1080233 RepID=A0A6A6CPQ0_ZASCE|nr:uncharacterized protein M409DRAFT_21556 [Zasmidium cellare ATCC 36951]KAF2168110.1 hypothetical protein M409DRAFT_21556 [Zasmidium cellare ATCC 36951]
MENGVVNGHGFQPVSTFWPTRYLEASVGDTADKASTALIVLNTPISDYTFFKRLYNHAGYVVCADGGANRLHDLLVNEFSDQEAVEALKSSPPNAIHGDLDSLERHVREQYEQIGTSISLDPDQYSTDFQKAIKKTVEQKPNTQNILILGSIAGRVDQGIGLLHEMYREQRLNHPELTFWLFSEASISIVLRRGTTAIHTPLKSGLITPNVGILPLYGRASITIQGFEWDVEDWPTEMGGQVSTSNHIVADQVTITTDVSVLFTVERKVGR